MKIPFLNLFEQDKTYIPEIMSALKRQITGSEFILGKENDLFEREFANFVGAEFCLGVASGTDAILLALKALGIQKGDEVIIPPMTFIATASAIILLGATPVFADIDARTHTIDPIAIEKKITKKTKAIISVDLYGMPCDYAKLQNIAKKYKLFLIEDACQAHGSLYNNKMTGTFGDIAAFSFYPSKNLGAYGDAGAITTNNKRLAKQIQLLRNHGQSKRYEHKIIGYNSRLDSLQAAILRIKLRGLTKQIKKRQHKAEIYNSLLKNLPIDTPFVSESTKPNYYLYTIRTKKRNLLVKYLAKQGVQTAVHYPKPLHIQDALAFLGYKKGEFPQSETFANECLSLPLTPITTKEEIEYVVKLIEKFFS